MTPKQAWDILNQVTSLVALKREDHQMVVNALETLKPKESLERQLIPLTDEEYINIGKLSAHGPYIQEQINIINAELEQYG